jgi:ribonuclease HIII
MTQPSCFSATIDLKLADKLKADLTEQGFEFSRPPYTLFSAKKKGISCTLYESGKLTVQGKEMGPFLEFYLEPEILKEFQYSHPIAHLDLSSRIGMDEAGKGDFFGPLCVAALYADAEGIQTLQQWGVRDSKRMADAVVLKLAGKIRAQFAFTVIRLFPTKYNELYDKFKNLNRLLAWTHVAALKEVSEKTGCKKAILDQFADPSLVQMQLRQKKLEVELEQKTKAESDMVVAGASILARAGFLEGLQMLSEEYQIPLPKGAHHGLQEAVQALYAKFGKEVLSNVAKVHFKIATRAE